MLANRFELDDETFEAWWSRAVLPEDAAEFVHLLQGTKDAARFVCAWDGLCASGDRPHSNELVVRAYLFSKGYPEEAAGNVRYRAEALALWEDDAVRALIEVLRYRERRAAEERIATRMCAKLEELYDRAAGEEDPKDRRTDERVALDGSLRFLTIQEQARERKATRRDKRALVEAIGRSRAQTIAVGAPPTPDEARHFLLMLKETLGPQGYADVLASTQEALPAPKEASP